MIVVDTNILAYYALPGPRSGNADLLAEREPAWAAPVLWRSEFRNVLAGHIRVAGMKLNDALDAIHRAAQALQGGEHMVNDQAVIELVARSKCSAYDCEFVALADALETVLVTEDKALLNAFPKVCVSLEAAVASGPASLRRRTRS